MAILNVKIPTNLTEYPNSFKRQGSFPLEAYSVFYDITNDEGAVVTSALDAAKDYAKNNPIAYVGQIIAVIEDTVVGEETVKTATAYVIDNAAGDLKAIGASEAITSGIEELEGQIDAIEVVIGDETSGLIKDIADNADAIDAINEKIGTVGEDTTVVDMIAAAEESAVDRVLGYLAEEVVNEDFDTLKEVAAWIESDTTNSAELIERVDALEKDTHTHENDDVLKGITAEKVEAWDGAEQGAKDYADGLKDELIGLIDKRVLAEDGKSLVSNTLISKLEGIADGAQVNAIDTVDTAQFGLTGKHLTLLDIAMGKVTGLTDALAGKLDKPTDGSRLLTEDEATKLEKLVLGENGEVSVSGKVAAGNVDGLDAWITARAGTLKGLSENNFTGTLLEKLNGVEAGAQVNVIEKVKVGDTLLDIVDKTVAIPVASSTLLGAVKSSAEANKVAVAEDGTMEVNSLNVNKLVQSEGDVIVLDGGASK